MTDDATSVGAHHDQLGGEGIGEGDDLFLRVTFTERVTEDDASTLEARDDLAQTCNGGVADAARDLRRGEESAVGKAVERHLIDMQHVHGRVQGFREIDRAGERLLGGLAEIDGDEDGVDREGHDARRQSKTPAEVREQAGDRAAILGAMFTSRPGASSLRLARAGLLGAALVLGVLACGPSAGTGPLVKPPPPAPLAKPAKPPTTPSRWAIHPSLATMHLLARLELGSAGALYAGLGGERWLDGTSGMPPTPANTLLPEIIQAISRNGAELLFVGGSGTVYATTEPLGPVTAKRAPPQPMHAVAAGKQAILGIGKDLSMQRSPDGGATWQRVSLPPLEGTLTQLAMLPTGHGLALFAPQRVLATVDDGATWTALPTLGVGARKVVADVNGDLILEGVEASGILREAPLRFEKIARAPTREYELASGSGTAKQAPAYGFAAQQGHGVFVGTRWVELVQSEAPGGQIMWVLADGEVGEKPATRPVRELDGCELTELAASATSLVVACEREGKPSENYQPNKKPKVEERHHVELFHSDDDGKTWRADGKVGVASGFSPHVFLGPDGLLVIDGGCKRSHNDWTCDESPPVVRVAGQTTFAKVFGVPYTRFYDMVFDEKKGHAFAVGIAGGGMPIGLFVSTNGGKDFVRKSLPAIRDGELTYTVSNVVESASLGIDDSGVYVGASVNASGGGLDRLAVYRTSDDGAIIAGHLAPAEADVVAVGGKHAMAYSTSGRAWETTDGGASWSSFEAPTVPGSGDIPLVCGNYGCHLADRATRVGWDDKPADASSEVKTPKVVALSALQCQTQGTPNNLGTYQGLPTAGNADLGGGTRFTLGRHNTIDGSVVALVGERKKDGGKDKDKGGFEVKELTLFGPAPKDTATYMAMQLEGVVALRYTFRRDVSGTTIKTPPPPLNGKPPASAFAPITQKQLVDVQIAWYVAATGKVYKATIKGAGPLEPYKDVVDGRDKPSTSRPPNMLSIAMGGVHVRPFASALPTDALYFVTDAGKVDKLTFPEFPKTDVSNRPLGFRLDAARVGKRSVVFGNGSTGLQMVMAWSTEGQSWEMRTWGLWPEYEHGSVRLRYLDSGATPAFGVYYSDSDLGSLGWMTPLRAPDVDPPTPIAIPSAAQLGDTPRACNKVDWSGTRLALSYEPGTRHPVFVNDDGREIDLATSQTIVRFTSAKEWCVSSFEAVAIAKTNPPQSTALIAPDDLEHAAFFNYKDGQFTVRPMSCTWAKGKLPDKANTIDGFVVP